MACADGGEQKEQKPDGSQLAVPDGLLDAASLATTRAPVPDGPQVEPHEGGQEVRSGSQLPLSDGPERFTIGTKKAFAENRAYPYEKKEIAGEIVYFCNKGSQWSRPNEFLVLRRDDGNWTAFDSAFFAGGHTLEYQSFVALRRTLHGQDGISGKPITLPVPMTPALGSIGRALFGLKTHA